MKIKTLFETYEVFVTNRDESEKIFADSGMVNNYRKLDFGFFPLGSGILSDNASKSLVDKAKFEDDGIMVLGHDFGTVSYLETGCKDNREHNSKTITNLLNLGISPDTTFFTNFYLGLRNDKLHEGTTMTKRVKKLKQDYKDLCYNFFQVQLEFINPKTVLCLGVEVGHALSTYSNLFSTFSKNNKITKLYADDSEKFIVKTDDSIWGKRKFILIPHPSYAHVNWKNNIRNKIIEAINS